MNGATVVEVMRHEFMPDFWSVHATKREFTVPIYFRSVNSIRVSGPQASSKHELAELRSQLETAERETAALRRKVANLEARLTQPQTPDGILAAMAARNAQEFPTWMPLPDVLALEMVDPKIMPGSTANDLCKRYLRWRKESGDEETRPHNAIGCRQPGGAGTLITVKVTDFFAVYDRRAARQK
ncbi:hypothetical protein QY049_15725 [Bradyrhizobium sp. WYCCWR 13022]|uniref:hypothetical protein n=1 Tax=unclassified Bradyrhizobium TaxID=2631580 RepID=UPI00263B123C|nr:hypothetical protein [Bradyrhizobium sp. WYCCWR 13022]MDN4984652.1 hypothetical protein [Bradyrhizobium sp. WYCCWR 13022]